jgi:uncharacterized pyridoxamine 5'-phosphate oxidase family protein
MTELKLYFQHKQTKDCYKVIKLDSKAGTITLEGPAGIQFVEPYDKERFKRQGYELKKGEPGNAK